jgi:hypothetical protein
MHMLYRYRLSNLPRDPRQGLLGESTDINGQMHEVPGAELCQDLPRGDIQVLEIPQESRENTGISLRSDV